MNKNITERSRVPAGVTTGGQFAAGPRGEADLSLTGQAESQPGPELTAENIEFAREAVEEFDNSDDFGTAFEIQDWTEQQLRWDGPNRTVDFFDTLRAAVDRFDATSGT